MGLLSVKPAEVLLSYTGADRPGEGVPIFWQRGISLWYLRAMGRTKATFLADSE
jgi:hypothetical protein